MPKNLYHSALCKEGPTWLTVTGDVRQSKFPDKPDYCAVTINGEECYYSVESDAIAATLKEYKGATIEVQASGFKETSLLEVLSVQDGSAPAPAARPAAAPRPAAPRPAAPAARPAPQRAAAPAPAASRAPVAHSAPAAVPVASSKPPEQAIGEARDFVERQRLLLELCAYEAGKLAVQYNTVFMKDKIEAGVTCPATPEMIQAWTSCLFIESNKAGIGRTLPTDSENDNVPM